MKFAELAGSQSLFKRIVDEIARPVYAVPPRRQVFRQEQAVETRLPSADEIIKDVPEQEAASELWAECRIDRRMDLLARLMVAHNHAFGMFRLVSDGEGKDSRLVLDVMTPENVTVIPHPDDLAKMIGFIYDTTVFLDGKPQTAHVYWDDSVTFRFTNKNGNGALISMPDGKSFWEHDYGRIPVFEVHKSERWGEYWDETSGNDMVQGQQSIMMLMTQLLRMQKGQSWRQMVVTGDMNAIPKDQLLDEEGAFQGPEGTNVQAIDLATPPDHFWTTIEKISTATSANHGVSRERLNQKTESQNEQGLLERRAEIIATMASAEKDAFEILKAISQNHPKHKLADDLRFRVDFVEVEALGDKEKLMNIWDGSSSRGLSNVLDNIKQLNPEIRTDKEAIAELMRNLAIKKYEVDLKREMNMPSDGVGFSPEVNGSTGPLVRDGVISPDQIRERIKDAMKG
jgi:hypothetical protein